jgi:hypothetical protein
MQIKIALWRGNVQPAPLLRIISALLISSLTATTVHPAATKTKKSGSGDQSSSGGDQSSSGDGSDDSSGGKKDKSGGGDASKGGDSSKGDTSKTGFDDGTYAEATAITYKAMQSIAAGIAAKGKNTDGTAKANTYVVFDPTTFANIAQYRITFPQVVLLRTSFCSVFEDIETEKQKEKPKEIPPDNQKGYGAANTGGGLDLSPAGQIVDLAQKVLTMMQTTTTIAGASVNVTDEALVSEVANQLANSPTKPSVYFPGEFLLPDVDEASIQIAISNGCKDAPALGTSHHIVAEVVRVGVAREKAAQEYQLLSAALDKYNLVVNPAPKKTDAPPATPAHQPSHPAPNTASHNGKPKLGAQGVEQPAAAAADLDKKPQPTEEEKAAALKAFFSDTGFTSTIKATGFQTNLKAHMDAYDALLTSLAATDSKGQSIFSRLVIAERLDAILKLPTKTNSQDKTTGSDLKANTNESVEPEGPVNVVVVKWLRAGALNKTRKNLFFLGQRNYYAGGATGLYEYYGGDQKMYASGTITATSSYVHDKDFDKKKIVTMIDLATP